MAGITINGALIHNVEYETFTMDSVPGPIKIIHIQMRDSVKIEVRVIQDQRYEFPVLIKSPSVSFATTMDDEDFDELTEWLFNLGYFEMENVD